MRIIRGVYAALASGVECRLPTLQLTSPSQQWATVLSAAWCGRPMPPEASFFSFYTPERRVWLLAGWHTRGSERTSLRLGYISLCVCLCVCMCGAGVYRGSLSLAAALVQLVSFAEKEGSRFCGYVGQKGPKISTRTPWRAPRTTHNYCRVVKVKGWRPHRISASAQ